MCLFFSRKRKHDDDDGDDSAPAKRERGETDVDAATAAAATAPAAADGQAANDEQAQPGEAQPVGAATTDAPQGASSDAAGEAYFARLRGLPFSATVPQLMVWLNGLPLAQSDRPSAIIEYDHLGRSSGNAYVQLADHEALERILSNEFNRKLLGTRYVEVFKSDVNDFQRCLRMQPAASPATYGGAAPGIPYGAPGTTPSYGAPAGVGGPIVMKLRGCAFETNEMALRAFFDHCPGIQAVHIVHDERGRASGDAFIELSSEEYVKDLQAKHKQMIDGRRYIEVFRSDANSMAQRMAQSGTPAGSGSRFGTLGSGYGSQGGGGGYGRGGGGSGTGYAGEVRYGSHSAPRGSTTCIRVRGLPWNSTEEDLTGFFAEANVFPLRLHRNQGSGEAFVEFHSVQDLNTAMTRNKQYMRGSNRYLELIPVPYAELAATVGLPQTQPTPAPQQSSYAPPPGAYAPQGYSSGGYGASSGYSQPAAGGYSGYGSSSGAQSYSGYGAPSGGYDSYSSGGAGYGSYSSAPTSSYAAAPPATTGYANYASTTQQQQQPAQQQPYAYAQQPQQDYSRGYGQQY